MKRLFDAYIIVDWSAAAKPVTGANSIWVGIRARDARLKFQFNSANPKTRRAGGGYELRQFDRTAPVLGHAKKGPSFHLVDQKGRLCVEDLFA